MAKGEQDGLGEELYGTRLGELRDAAGPTQVNSNDKRGGKMEITAKYVDRLVTTEAKWGGENTRGITDLLYDCAFNKLGGQSPSLVAARRIIEEVHEDDDIFIMTEFAAFPSFPFGETDGPPGVASLARAVTFGLGALPILISGVRDAEPIRITTKAAGLNVLEYSVAKESNSLAASAVVFPVADGEESKKFAAAMMDEYSPKAVIAVETVGPNRKGVKHRGAGTNAEEIEKMPELEHLFYEAASRGILTIGIIDQGNELGSGTIEEDVRRITPFAEMCTCSCGEGIACSVKADIVLPATTSNWGAYAISAMLAYLLKKPEILQDAYTEHRMLEACVMAGALDSSYRAPVMGVDGNGYEANEAIVTLLQSIITNALKQ